MSESNDHWTAGTSEIYRQLAAVAIPARAEQIATLLTLMPFERDESFRVVELASGEGYLSEAILRAFPNAILHALDGEESMREATAQRLSKFGNRASCGGFDIRTSNWYSQIEGVDCVLSSLCIHHLDRAEKQVLFLTVSSYLTARGVFLIADLVQPQRSEVHELFAATWDRAARTQAAEKTGSDELYQMFQDEKWNYFRYTDPIDKPSSLFDQLMWLRDSGFVVVDCFWMQAGHAIFGGYKSHGDEASSGIGFEEALGIARTVLEAV